MELMAENKTADIPGWIEQIPSELEGWKKSDKQEQYGKENLYQYINGGAELYISYRFRKVFALPFVKEGQQPIKVDVFDMESDRNAYGIFSHSRETEDHFVSDQVQSEYASGLLTFWKGPYYVSILAYPETAEKKLFVKALAVRIAKLIKEPGQKPEIVSRLPQKGLVKQSIRYFRNHVWLNSHHYISSENILRIDDSVEAVLAKYRLGNDGKTSGLLLLIEYRDNKLAKEAQDSFLNSYLPKHIDGFYKKDNLWVGCQVNDRRIAIVFKGTDLKTAKKIINGI